MAAQRDSCLGNSPCRFDPGSFDLAADISRAYTLLVHQWLDHMKYLYHHYPYLFSLAMRTNPFDKEASPIVK